MGKGYQWVRKESKKWVGLTRHSREAIAVFSGAGGKQPDPADSRLCRRTVNDDGCSGL